MATRLPGRVFSTFVWVFLLGGCGGEAPGLKFNQGFTRAWLSFGEQTAYNFPLLTVGSSAEATFTLTNSGGTKATAINGTFDFTSAFTYKGGTYPGEGGDCSTELGSLESCRVVVVFAPTYSGDFSAVLRAGYFDGVENRQTTQPTLKGRGVP